MLINSTYVDGKGGSVSIITGFYECDGKICVPLCEFNADDMEIIDIENDSGGA